MKVIAFSGWKGSGKDTVAGYLIEKYGAVRTSFAGPLKDMAAEEYGFPREHADDPAFKEAPLLHLPVDPQDAFTRMVTDFMRLEFRSADGKKITEVPAGTIMYWTPRALCILKGSTNRAVASQFWVSQAVSCIKIGGAPMNVLTDLRYQSEMGQLKEAFGSDVLFVRVNRFDTSPSVDPSERDLDNAEFDFYIHNRGTLEQAFEQIEFVMGYV